VHCVIVNGGENRSNGQFGPDDSGADKLRIECSLPMPRTLPPWAFDMIRPVVGGVSKLLWSISFKGLGHIPDATSGLLIAANHQSYIDPFWVSLPIKRPIRFLAWKEAFGWPVVGKAMSLLGAWPLQLEKGNPSAMRRSVQWLRSGGALVIFPEGARATSDGRMQRFKHGAVRLALEADVPILPVTIRGGNSVWPKGHRVPRFGHVEIVYHPVQQIALAPGTDEKEYARSSSQCLFDVIQSALREA
jgi:1-acyl-sn-glycerol-3-phosphate acyltransferase